MKAENTAEKISRLLAEQFAIDYGCSVSDFCSKETLVTELRPNAQARKRKEPGILSILSYRGKLVIAAAPELMDWSRSVLAKHCSAEWCFVAGATANSERMWEMGVNSFAEGKGYAVSVLSALTQEILKQGKVPYSGTAISHLASQNVSLRAGLVPTFCELTTKRFDA